MIINFKKFIIAVVLFSPSLRILATTGLLNNKNQAIKIEAKISRKNLQHQWENIKLTAD